jgi:hypothetical protein
MSKSVNPSSYPFDWLRIEQCIKPVGPFGRSKFFELLRSGVFKTKTLQVGHGARTMTLVSVESVNAFLNGPGVGSTTRRQRKRTANTESP